MSKIRTKKPDEKAEELFFLLWKDQLKIINYMFNELESIKFKHEDDRIWWALVKEEFQEMIKLNDQR